MSAELNSYRVKLDPYQYHIRSSQYVLFENLFLSKKEKRNELFLLSPTENGNSLKNSIVVLLTYLKKQAAHATYYVVMCVI